MGQVEANRISCRTPSKLNHLLKVLYRLSRILIFLSLNHVFATIAEAVVIYSENVIPIHIFSVNQEMIERR